MFYANFCYKILYYINTRIIKYYNNIIIILKIKVPKILMGSDFISPT